MRVILASASPARLRTLRNAGIEPEVVVSGLDETGVSARTVPALVATLARLKAEAVAERLDFSMASTVLLGCDSLLEVDGRAYGKPADREDVLTRWRRLRGRSAVLHTGHHVLLLDGGTRIARAAVASTRVDFAEPDDLELEAYVDSGEPLEVAGAFTIDGRGGAFVRGLVGDPHNVVGISLPLLRTMLAELGVRWTDLWRGGTAGVTAAGGPES